MTNILKSHPAAAACCAKSSPRIYHDPRVSRRITWPWPSSRGSSCLKRPDVPLHPTGTVTPTISFNFGICRCANRRYDTLSKSSKDRFQSGWYFINWARRYHPIKVLLLSWLLAVESRWMVNGIDSGERMETTVSLLVLSWFVCQTHRASTQMVSTSRWLQPRYHDLNPTSKP